MRERGRDGRRGGKEGGKSARERGGRMGDGGEREHKETQESDGVERQGLHS